MSEPIKDSLLAQIQGGKLQPGGLVPSERELMREFQVGRPAVREAMQSLQLMGLVSIRHGGRARVAEPSISHLIDQMGETICHYLAHTPTNLEHLKEARILFETEMVKLAARKRSKSDINRLHAAHEAHIAASNDLDRFVACDGQFHREIAAISANPIYTALSEAVFQWLARFYRGAVTVPGLEKIILAEHAQILKAIEMRDSDGAAKAMRDHLLRANELFRKVHFVSREQGR